MLGFFAVAATPDLQGQLTFKPFPKGLLIGIGFPPPLSQMTINASSSQDPDCVSPRARTSAETTHKNCESCIAIHFALVNRYII